MKLLLLSLCLATTASGDFLVPAWTAKEENVIQTLTTKHTPDLRKSCVMVGRLGLSEIRTAVFITENGDLMVIGDEVPREPEAGTPDWEFPTLKSGQIVQVSEAKATHALVSTDETSFWIPLSQLKQVW